VRKTSDHIVELIHQSQLRLQHSRANGAVFKSRTERTVAAVATKTGD
jgi:hypothetical protein